MLTNLNREINKMYKTKELCNTQEKLVSALETIKTVEILNKNEFLGIGLDPFESNFTRNLKVLIRGNEFTIEWYHNQSTIICDIFQSPFDSIVLNKPTWPLVSGSPLKLQLLLGDKTVLIL